MYVVFLAAFQKNIRNLDAPITESVHHSRGTQKPCVYCFRHVAAVGVMVTRRGPAVAVSV